MSKLLRCVVSLALLGGGAAQAQNLVTNGNFDLVTNNAGVVQATPDNYVINAVGNASGQFTKAYNLPGWTNSSWLAFTFAEGMGDKQGFDGRSGEHFGYCGSGPDLYRQCGWLLRGSQDGNPVAAPYPVAATSPQGGNYFGTDATTYPGKVTQTVNGLVPGQEYSLSFWYAGGTLQSGQGANGQVGWNVTLGTGSTLDVNSSVKTAPYSSLGGLSPWTQQIISFTASSVSELLSFTPVAYSGPPIALLDGVSIVAVPEPAEWAMLGAGLLLLAARLRRRRTN